MKRLDMGSMGILLAVIALGGGKGLYKAPRFFNDGSFDHKQINAAKRRNKKNKKRGKK